jgi:hypothetical protein
MRADQFKPNVFLYSLEIESALMTLPFLFAGFALAAFPHC